MSSHAEQVASVLRRNVQEVIARGLSDPRVRGLVSVTGVAVSDDYSQATVSVSVLPAEHGPLTIRGLQHAASHVRSQVAKAVEMRRVPNLSFRLDDSLKKQAALHAAITRATASGECGAAEQSDFGPEDSST